MWWLLFTRANAVVRILQGSGQSRSSERATRSCSRRRRLHYTCSLGGVAVVVAVAAVAVGAAVVVAARQ